MKVFEFLKTRPDLKKHFLAGAFFGLLGAGWTLWRATKGGWNLNEFGAFIPALKNFQLVEVAVFCGVFVGIFKEVFWDAGLSKLEWVQKTFHLPEGCPDKQDFLWTMYGSIAMGIVVWIFSFFVYVPEPTKIPSNRELLENVKYKLEHVHDNDPASFSSDSLKNRADSLLKKLE